VNEGIETMMGHKSQVTSHTAQKVFNLTVRPDESSNLVRFVDIL
jgi:hypothetical protein